MKINKSKSLYVFVLMALIATAIVDARHEANSELNFQIQPKATNQLTENNEIIINQNIEENENQDSFYSMLLPCD